MRRLIPVGAAFAVCLLLATIAAAQGTARLTGQVLDLNGKPYADVTVDIKNPETGRTYTVKTDKDGRYAEMGLMSGAYEIRFIDEKVKLDFKVVFRVVTDQESVLNMNFKEIVAKQGGPSAEDIKKKEDEENKFKNVKLHFDTGFAAITEANDLQKQLRTAATGQKSALQEKRLADCQTAFKEFQQAEQGVAPKEVKNHAVILGHLGAAAECVGRFDDAATAFQKAVELQPQPTFYLGLATNLANVGVSLTDPKAGEAKFAEANAACDKAVALDVAVGSTCWKNLGIVLTNKGRQKEAIVPYQKATQVDPKDAQTWFLLGNAFSAGIDSKQQGDKMIYTIPPGTIEAYQKCIDVAPNGQYAAQAKDVLAGLAAMGGGEETSVSSKKKKKQ